MKKLHLLIFIAALAMTACKDKSQNTTQDNQANTTLQPERIELDEDLFDKENKYANVRISIQIADEDDDKTPVATAINRQLLQEIDKEFNTDIKTDKQAYAPYRGDSDDSEDIVKYYGEKTLQILTANSKKDQEIRLENLSESQADLAQQTIFQYSHYMDLHSSFETDRFIVFNINTSTYYGGAHPNSATRALTFDKTDGTILTQWFTPQAIKDLQPILRKGLTEYFDATDQGQTVTEANLNQYLQIEGTEIPLPSNIQPTKDGLALTYGQYEIACYAMGMPTLTIPYATVRPYLSMEAQQLLPKE